VGGNTRDGSTPFSRITKLLEISDFRAAIGGAVALPRRFRRTVLGPITATGAFRDAAQAGKSGALPRSSVYGV
jgi:hypothetical protein